MNHTIDSTVMSDSLIVLNIDELNKDQPLNYSSIFKNYKIVPLESKKECLIGHISQVQVYNDTIYVLDSSIAKSLLLFEINGKYIRKIGAVGKGPGEYISPVSFSIDKKNNQVLIADPKSKRILIFSSGGKFVKNIPTIGALFANDIITQNGFLYVDNMTLQNAEKDFLLYSMDYTGKINYRWLSSNNYSKGFDQTISFSSSFCLTPNNIKYIKPMFDTIFSIKDSILKPFIAISTNDKITPEDIKQLNSKTKGNDFVHYYINKCNKFIGVSNYVETSSLIHFRYLKDKKNNHLFYWTKNKDTYWTTKFIDDLTYVKYPNRFISTYKNQFISYAEDDYETQTTKAIKNSNDGKKNISDKENRHPDKLKINGSNPAIIFYECREEILLDEKLNSKTPI